MRRMLLVVAALVLVAASPAAADLVDDCYKAGVEDPDKTIAICTRAIQSGVTGRNLSVSHNNRGRGYQEKGDMDRALADFDAAIRINPRNAYAWDNRGDFWRQKGDYDRAISDYNEAIRIDGTFLSAYVNRAETFEKMGNRRSARADYQAVLDSTGQDREIDRWAKRIARQRLDRLDGR